MFKDLSDLQIKRRLHGQKDLMGVVLVFSNINSKNLCSITYLMEGKNLFLPSMFKTAPSQNSRLLTRQIELIASEIPSTQYASFEESGFLHLGCSISEQKNHCCAPTGSYERMFTSAPQTLCCRFNNLTATIYVKTAVLIMCGVRFDDSRYCCRDSISICCHVQSLFF